MNAEILESDLRQLNFTNSTNTRLRNLNLLTECRHKVPYGTIRIVHLNFNKPDIQ